MRDLTPHDAPEIMPLDAAAGWLWPHLWAIINDAGR